MNDERIVWDDSSTDDVVEDKLSYTDSTYEIVSKVAYLIGVPKRIFENEYEPPKLEIYNKLDSDKNARIIRNLCVIRTAIEQNFKSINYLMKTQYKSLVYMPEYVPTESISRLSMDGVTFIKKSSTMLYHHIIELNRLISDRINNCKDLFPLWLNWQYLKDIFIMPDGLTESGTIKAAEIYYANKYDYPYKIYINWKPEKSGNILYNDKKFITLLYKWNDDSFDEFSKVSDAGSYIKGNVYDHIEKNSKTVVVVDCENSDPYKLSAVFKNLDSEYTSKISNIILFDDINTVDTWRILERFTDVPVEHMMIDRVKQNKSLVDIALTARACKEHYQNSVDSFIIVSSDSDYWGLITSLPEAEFLVMIEHDSCSPELKSSLEKSGIFYCYIDDFYSANAEDIKYTALFGEMYRYISDHVDLNVNDMLSEALYSTRIAMTQSEKQQFFMRFIKNMQMEISDEGEVRLFFKHK